MPASLPCPLVHFEEDYLRRVDALHARLAAVRQRREGGGRASIVGPGEDFVGYRPYSPGEDLRRLVAAQVDLPGALVEKEGIDDVGTALLSTPDEVLRNLCFQLRDLLPQHLWELEQDEGTFPLQVAELLHQTCCCCDGVRGSFSLCCRSYRLQIRLEGQAGIVCCSRSGDSLLYYLQNRDWF